MEKVLHCFGWLMLLLLVAFVVNTGLNLAFGWASAVDVFSGEPSLAAAIRLGVYVLAVGGAFYAVYWRTGGSLHQDAISISAFNTFLLRGCFWAVLLIGVADTFISFLRAEDWLASVFGEALKSGLGQTAFRGTYLHMPLLALGFIIAWFRKGKIDFVWLVLLIFIAELLIVFSRFGLSYEQPFQSDLVRFWYSAIFLFGSAYTLREEGHVRVDILYTTLSQRSRSVLDALGCIVFGILFCWTILLIGMGPKTGIIINPALTFEISQAGFGLYVKYLMALFLGVFAITMLIEFVAYYMKSVANALGDNTIETNDQTLAHDALSREH